MAGDRAIFLAEPRERDRTRLRIEPVLGPLRELARRAALSPGGASLAEVTLRELPRSFLGRVRLARECRDATLVLPARLLSWPALAMLRSAAGRLILDLDDAMGEVPDDRPIADSPTRRGRLRRTLAVVDLVTTGSDSLAAMVRARGPADLAITTIPNPSPLTASALTLRPSPEPTLLWIGSRSTRPYLDALRPALEELAAEVPGLTLRVIADAGAIADERARAPGALRVDIRRWSETEAARGLSEAWLGLMPLGATAWSRGKSGYKLLQYMAAGLPALATAGGVADELLPANSPGLVRDPEGWGAAARRLLADQDLRRREGLANRRRVEQRYTPERIAERWLAALSESGQRAR